jgi:hypothetical protein
MSAFDHRPSPALVVASLALFVALGGVAYGVAENSIGTRAIKDGSVHSRDVRNDSLLGSDIKNGTVRGVDVHRGAIGSSDVADGSLRGGDLAVGTVGDREIADAELDPRRLGGVAAGRYVRDVRQVRVQSVNDASTPKRPPPATCPPGTRVLGGGAHAIGAGPSVVAFSDNGPRRRSWTASAYATAPTGSWQLVVIAICG